MLVVTSDTNIKDVFGTHTLPTVTAGGASSWFSDITNPGMYINVPAPRNTQQRGRAHVALL